MASKVGRSSNQQLLANVRVCNICTQVLPKSQFRKVLRNKDGLSRPDNLQYLTKSANSSKGNRYSGVNSA